MPLLLCCVKQPHAKQTGASELDARPAAVSLPAADGSQREGQRPRGATNDSVWLAVQLTTWGSGIYVVSNTSVDHVYIRAGYHLNVFSSVGDTMPECFLENPAKLTKVPTTLKY